MKSRQLVTSGVGRFKSWSKSQNQFASQATYTRTFNAKQTGNAFYMERLGDKDTLFGAKGTTWRSQLENSLSLFTPQKMGRGLPRAWSPQINDSWLIAHLDKGNRGILASPPTKANLWSESDNRPTATGREVLHTLSSGYSAVVGNVDTPLGSRPMFMNPLPNAGRFGGVPGIDHVEGMAPWLQKAQLSHLHAQFTVMDGHDKDGQILKDAFVTDSISKRDAAPFPALYAPNRPKPLVWG